MNKTRCPNCFLLTDKEPTACMYCKFIAESSNCVCCNSINPGKDYSYHALKYLSSKHIGTEIKIFGPNISRSEEKYEILGTRKRFLCINCIEKDLMSGWGVENVLYLIFFILVTVGTNFLWWAGKDTKVLPFVAIGMVFLTAFQIYIVLYAKYFTKSFMPHVVKNKVYKKIFNLDPDFTDPTFKKNNCILSRIS